MNCEFCDKAFSTKGNLIKHQKSTKYCIKIQKKSGKEVEEIQKYTCSFCDKKFYEKSNFTKHELICNEKPNKKIEVLSNEIEKLNKNLLEKDEKICKLEFEILQLKEENKMIEIKTEKRMLEKQTQHLQSTVDEIAKQPRTTNNNNNKILITTPLDLSKESVKNAIESGFSQEHLMLGQKGVAQFAYNKILKDNDGKLKYICTDPSRQIFQYKSDDGKIQKDVRATKLTQALLNSEIKTTSHKIAWDNMKDGDNEIFMEYTNYYQDIQSMESDNTDFRKELSNLTTK
jgi:hypothetical protein